MISRARTKRARPDLGRALSGPVRLGKLTKSRQLSGHSWVTDFEYSRVACTRRKFTPWASSPWVPSSNVSQRRDVSSTCAQKRAHFVRSSCHFTRDTQPPHWISPYFTLADFPFLRAALGVEPRLLWRASPQLSLQNANLLFPLFSFAHLFFTTQRKVSIQNLVTIDRTAIERSDTSKNCLAIWKDFFRNIIKKEDRFVQSEITTDFILLLIKVRRSVFTCESL